MPSTLVSNNFSPRNNSFRKTNDSEEGETFPETPDDEDSNNTNQGMSAYEQLRANRIKRNRDRLIELGLLDGDNEGQEQGDQGFLAASMATASLNDSPPSQKRRNPSAGNRAHVRKSPRSSANSSPKSSTPQTRFSLRLAAMRVKLTIDDDDDDGHPTINSTSTPSSNEKNSTTTTIITQGQAVGSRRSTWFTSEKGKEVYSKGVAKKKLLMGVHGDKMLHPMRLKIFESNKGMVLPEKKEEFTNASAEFLRYHAESCVGAITIAT